MKRLILALALCAMTLTGCGTAATTQVADKGPAVDESLHARLPAAIRSRGELVVGTDPSYAPMSSYAHDGRTIVGMEPDLAKDLGRLLGVKVRMRDVAFDTILGDVGTAKFDIALSAITDTAERAKKVSFVDYFRTGTAIVVQRGNPRHITRLVDLCGRQAAVEKATVQVELLKRTQLRCKGNLIKILQFPSNSDALLKLRTGRVDAVLSDLPPAALLTSSARTKEFYELASSAQYDPGCYGLVVAKDDVELRTVLTEALEQLHADGEYAAILRRWGLQSGAIPDIMVNSDRP